MSKSCPFCEVVKNQRAVESRRKSIDEEIGCVGRSTSEFGVTFVHKRFRFGRRVGEVSIYFDRLSFCPLCGTEFENSSNE